MNATERKQFIYDHLNGIRNRLLFQAEHMPDSWDAARIQKAIECTVSAAAGWAYDREFSDGRTRAGKEFWEAYSALPRPSDSRALPTPTPREEGP